MTSWAGNRGYALPKKQALEVTEYFQPTAGGICSNLNSFFYAYLRATTTSNSLYVYDRPNCVSDNFPMFQSILRENSLIKYLKDQPTSGKRLDYSTIFNSSPVRTIPFRRLKELARGLYFYNSETQDKIMGLIQAKGLERTFFDVGVHIRSGDKLTTGEMSPIPIENYVEALKTFSRRLGKSNLNVFVMTDNYQLYKDLIKESPTTWTFTTLDEAGLHNMGGHTQLTFNTLSVKSKTELFYLFLTELHIMQNIPNLVVTFSSNVGRFLYLTSRLIQTTDNVISLDVSQWSIA